MHLHASSAATSNCVLNLILGQQDDFCVAAIVTNRDSSMRAESSLAKGEECVYWTLVQ